MECITATIKMVKNDHTNCYCTLTKLEINKVENEALMQLLTTQLIQHYNK